MKSTDIRLTDKEKRNQVLLCLDYTGLKVNKQGVFYLHRHWLSLLGAPFLALPLGELSPKVTERALAGIENIGDTPRKKCYTLEKVCKGKGVDGHV